GAVDALVVLEHDLTRERRHLFGVLQQQRAQSRMLRQELAFGFAERFLLAQEVSRNARLADIVEERAERKRRRFEIEFLERRHHQRKHADVDRGRKDPSESGASASAKDWPPASARCWRSDRRRLFARSRAGSARRRARRRKCSPPPPALPGGRAERCRARARARENSTRPRRAWPDARRARRAGRNLPPSPAAPPRRHPHR